MQEKLKINHQPIKCPWWGVWGFSEGGRERAREKKDLTLIQAINLRGIASDHWKEFIFLNVLVYFTPFWNLCWCSYHLALILSTPLIRYTCRVWTQDLEEEGQEKKRNGKWFVLRLMWVQISDRLITRIHTDGTMVWYSQAVKIHWK